VHCALSALAEHRLVQSPLHCALHAPSQSNEPGFPLQSPMHVVLQLDVHITSADALHCPLQEAWSFASQAALTLMGVHCAVHSPMASTLQFAFAETSMFPQSARLKACTSDV
jgi:hypothetical protein